MTDSFDSLRLPSDPLDPTTAFAQTLRGRIEHALGIIPVLTKAPSKGTSMTRTAPGHHVVTAYITCRGAADALAFYCDIFGAVEDGQRYVDESDGRLGHAEFTIGDTRIMLSDEYPDYGAVSPEALGGSPVMFTVYVDDVDTVFARAVAAGARGLRPPEDQPYGARMGALLDPWGHRWSVQTVTDGIERPIEGFELIPAAPERSNRAQKLLDGPTQLGYFAIWTADVERSTSFFSELFGWQIVDGGHIANIDPPGGLAGLDRRTASSPNETTTLYFQVPDVNAAAARVTELGGKVLFKTTYDSGGNAECLDPTGAPFQLHEPKLGYERQ
jgi:PhnB protein